MWHTNTKPPTYQSQQRIGGHGGYGVRRQGRHGGAGNTQATHTNKVKRFPNLYYCFICGYDVDNPVTTCPVADPTYHMLRIPREEEHMYANQGAIMAAQKK